MGEMPTNEPPVMPTDDGLDMPDASDETPRVSSLRPEKRAASVFSMRRLLNTATLLVAGVAILALAIHWLPDALPKPHATPNPRTVHAQQTLDARHPMPRGAGWKPAGPDWATDIAFSADGSVGYACGSYPPEPIKYIAVYHVAENAWETLPSPLPASTPADSCDVSVSPVDSADVVLTVQCLGCTGGSVLTSRLYRSHDGGANWKSLDLPPTTLITDSAWTNRSTLFLVAEDMTAAGTPAPTFSLLVSHGDSQTNGPLTEMPAKSLGAFGPTLGGITLISTGVTVYATVADAICETPCTFVTQSSDEGRSWTRDFTNVSIQTVNLSAAQYNTSTLIGWIFEQAAPAMFIMRSDDGGALWHTLPALPVNPGTGGAALFIAPDGAAYAFCFGAANAVYALPDGASSWQTVAALPIGSPVTVQYDAHGHAVALWGAARAANGSVGLSYFPLPGNAP